MKNTTCQHKNLTAFISEENIPLTIEEFNKSNNLQTRLLGYTCNDCNEHIFLYGHTRKQEIEQND